MIDILQKILESPAGSFSFVFGLMFLAGWLIHYVTKYVVSNKNAMKKLDLLSCEENSKKIEDIELKIATFPCDLHTKVLDRHDDKLDELKTDVVEMRGLMRLQFGVPLAQQKSPLSLNEEGLRIASENNLDAIIDDNWDKISAELQGLKTRNPYDIQEYCFDTAFADTTGFRGLKFVAVKDLEKMKIVAFKCGYPVLAISRVIGILIRDRYFAENGIDILHICETN